MTKAKNAEPAVTEAAAAEPVVATAPDGTPENRLAGRIDAVREALDAVTGGEATGEVIDAYAALAVLEGFAAAKQEG
jgi:hypothetical protein